MVLEAPLVVVEPVLLGIKDAADVALDVELVKDFLVSGAHNDTFLELRGSQKKCGGQNFIAVENFGMSANKLELASELGIEVLLDEFLLIFGANDLEVRSDDRPKLESVDVLLFWVLHYL